MKKDGKMLKTAESAQQNLPGRTLKAASEQEAPSEKLPSAASLAHPEPMIASAAQNSAVPVGSLDLPIAAPVASTASDDVRLRPLERIYDLVASHAVRLRESSADTLRVIIDPGAGIHLSLELRWRNGGIEAQACLHRGDFEHLSRHWAELQQRLEPRGIHLAALETLKDSTEENQPFHQPGRQSNDQEPTGSAPAEFSFGGAMTEPPAARRARGRTHRGWETWA